MFSLAYVCYKTPWALEEEGNRVILRMARSFIKHLSHVRHLRALAQLVLIIAGRHRSPPFGVGGKRLA